MNRALLSFIPFFLCLLFACDRNTLDNCGEGCPRGQLCVEGQCVAIELEEIQGRIGGLAVDVAPLDSAFLVSSIDPTTQQLLVTVVDEEVESRILHTFPETISPATAVAVGATEIGVVWREGSAFVYASRATTASAAFWQFQSISGDYVATDDFDLGIDSTDVPSVVFRDGRGTFRRLFRNDEGTGWSVQTIDDGSQVGGRGCDLAQASQPSIGVRPKLEILGTLVTSYYDAVCGDLRLARRFEGEWKVDVIDEGDDIANSSFDRVGRFSSVTQDVNGDILIAYFDETRSQLKLASERDGKFDLFVIDDGIVIDALARTRKSIVGAYNSIATRADGAQRIVYFDGTEQNLKVAAKNLERDSWETSVIDRNNIAGLHAHLSVVDGEFIAVYERVTSTTQTLSSELSWREVSP